MSGEGGNGATANDRSIIKPGVIFLRRMLCGIIAAMIIGLLGYYGGSWLRAYDLRLTWLASWVKDIANSKEPFHLSRYLSSQGITIVMFVTALKEALSFIPNFDEAWDDLFAPDKKAEGPDPDKARERDSRKAKKAYWKLFVSTVALFCALFAVGLCGWPPDGKEIDAKLNVIEARLDNGGVSFLNLGEFTTIVAQKPLSFAVSFKEDNDVQVPDNARDFLHRVGAALQECQGDGKGPSFKVVGYGSGTPEDPAAQKQLNFIDGNARALNVAKEIVVGWECSKEHFPERCIKEKRQEIGGINVRDFRRDFPRIQFLNWDKGDDYEKFKDLRWITDTRKREYVPILGNLTRHADVTVAITDAGTCVGKPAKIESSQH